VGLAREFKNIMVKRKVINLAAGVMLAGALRAVLRSLINDVILPPISAAASGANISNLSYIIKKAKVGSPPVAIGYGRFLQNTIDFAILAVVVSMILHAAEKLTDKEQATQSKNEKLLEEIRDLLMLQQPKSEN